MPTAEKKKKCKLTGDRPGFLRLINPGLSLFILFLLAPAVATADTGDRLYVKYPVVNLRSGPDITYPVTLKLNKGTALIEVQRQGSWVQVATGRGDVKSGWLYADLLRPAKDASKTKPESKKVTSKTKSKNEKRTTKRSNKTKVANKQTVDGPLFNLFTQAFKELNEKLKKKTGKNCFSKIDNPAHGVVQLTVNHNWAGLTRAQREQAMKDIFAIWNAAEGESVPITVDIIDTDGIRLLSKFRD